VSGGLDVGHQSSLRSKIAGARLTAVCSRTPATFARRRPRRPAGPMPANRAAVSRYLPIRMTMRKRPTTSGFSFAGRPGRRGADAPPVVAHSGSRRAISAQRYTSAASLRGGRRGRLRSAPGLVGGWGCLVHARGMRLDGESGRVR
jgi:hypothetical protein